MPVSFIKSQSAVIAVDFQGDFTEYKNGSLAVAGTGASYIDKVCKSLYTLREKGLKLFATQDYHPENHISFYTNNKGTAPLDMIEINGRKQVMWPPHCVENTPGAEVLADNSLFEAIVKKGCDPEFDSYSGFFDDGGASTGLDTLLREKGIQTVLVLGLATDYCVKATSMDALNLGFCVILIRDLCRGVAEDTQKAALKEMESEGIKIVNDLDELCSGADNPGK